MHLCWNLHQVLLWNSFLSENNDPLQEYWEKNMKIACLELFLYGLLFLISFIIMATKSVLISWLVNIRNVFS